MCVRNQMRSKPMFQMDESDVQDVVRVSAASAVRSSEVRRAILKCGKCGKKF